MKTQKSSCKTKEKFGAVTCPEMSELVRCPSVLALKGCQKKITKIGEKAEPAWPSSWSPLRASSRRPNQQPPVAPEKARNLFVTHLCCATEAHLPRQAAKKNSAMNPCCSTVMHLPRRAARAIQPVVTAGAKYVSEVRKRP